MNTRGKDHDLMNTHSSIFNNVIYEMPDEKEKLHFLSAKSTSRGITEKNNHYTQNRFDRGILPTPAMITIKDGQFICYE